MSSAWSIRLGPLALVLLIAGCDWILGPSTGEGDPPIETIEVGGPETIEVLQGALLTVLALDSEGEAIETEIEWLSSDTMIAAVDSGGLLIGQAPGTATITARAGDVTGSIAVEVREAEGYLVFYRQYDPVDPYQYPPMLYGFQVTHALGGGVRPIAEFEGSQHHLWGVPSLTSTGNTILFSNYSDYDFSVGMMSLDITFPEPYPEAVEAQPEYLRISPRNEVDPAWDPTQSRIAFVGAMPEDSLGNQIWRVFVWEAASDDFLQLVPDSADPLELDEPAWSPDGERLALSGCVDESCSRRGVYLVNADGSDLERVPLPEDRSWISPAWHPAGDRLVVLANEDASPVRGELFVATPDGEATLLADPDSGIPDEAGEVAPIWSGDGSMVFFAWYGDILSVRADGTGLTPVTSGDDYDRGPQWWKPPATP